MPVFSLAPEAGSSGRNGASEQCPAVDPNLAIKKFIKDLDAHEKRYQDEFQLLNDEATAILDKLQFTDAEDDENLERVERDLVAVQLRRSKLGKLFAEESQNEEKPWIISVRADQETVSWGLDFLFSDLESLLSLPLDLESGEQVGVDAAKDFIKSMEKVEIEKTGNNEGKGVAKVDCAKTLGEGHMEKAKMFHADQMKVRIVKAKMFHADHLNERNATRQRQKGWKRSGKDNGDEGTEGSSTSNASADSYAERLAQQNMADMEKRNGSPYDTIEVIRRKTPDAVVEEGEPEELDPIPFTEPTKVNTSARPPKTRAKRATVAEKKELLNPQRETDEMVRGLFPHPQTSPAFAGEASPQGTESSDGLFVTQRPPRQPRIPRAPSSPSSPLRETPARGQSMQGAVSTMGLSEGQDPSAASRRSLAPQPETRRRRGMAAADAVDNPFFGALPEEIVRFPEQDLGEEKVKTRSTDAGVSGALGLFEGPTKKKKKENEEGKSLGRVKWPGQAEVVKKGSKRG